MSTDSFFVAVGSRAGDVTGDAVVKERGCGIAVRGPRGSLARDGEMAIVAVGRLDNAAELERALDAAPRSPQETAADHMARLLLAAFRRWGHSFLDRAVGGFAGALVDTRRRHAHVFRDLAAGFSAYVTTSAGDLIAGSDLEEVSTVAQRRAVSPLFVAGYLQNVWLDGANTAFEGVHAVLPGHVATAARETGWRQTRYADWHVRAIRHREFTDYLDEFTELFDEAVRCRLEGAAKAGVALSGGLDSTNVLASAVRVAPEVAFTAYTIPFFTARGDERARQQEVAQHCGVPISWVAVEGRGPVGRWSGRLFAGRPTPPLGGNWYFGVTLFEHAAADGVGVLYDGEDADSLLAGNRTYLADLLVTGRLSTWLREARRIKQHERKSLNQLLRYSLYKQIPPWALALVGRRPMAAALSPLVAAPLAREVQLERCLQRLPIARIWHPGRRFSQYLKIPGAPLHVGLITPELDLGARGLPVVPAHPFFDRRLMTYCMGLPWDAVCGDLTPKRLLRALAQRRLPASLQGGATKARLDEYYDAAVYGHEKEYVMKGFDLAAARPDWIDAKSLDDVRRAVEDGTDSYMPSHVAMLMLWEHELSGSASVVG